MIEWKELAGVRVRDYVRSWVEIFLTSIRKQGGKGESGRGKVARILIWAS